MNAVVLTEHGLTFQTDYQTDPPTDWIAVDVLQAGICETDLQLVSGYMGFRGVLGHEFVGIARSGKFAGHRVVGEINCSCDDCDYCQASLATHCPYRRVLGILNHDGAFADTVWLPESNLHRVPDNVTNDEAVFVEPLAAAFQIPAQLDVSQFETVIILGDGRLGTLCAQVLQHVGATPIVVGKHPEKLARIERLCIRTQLLDELTDTRKADLVIDCTGSPTGLATACRIVKPRGTIVLKTTTADPHGPNLAPLVIDEITLIGSRCGPFPDAIAALAAKQLKVTHLITSRFPLQQAIEAFQTAPQKDQLKVILEGSISV